MSAMKKMVLISQAEYSQMTSNTIKRPAGTTRFQTMQNLLDESQDSRREKQESHKTDDKKCSNNNDSNDDADNTNKYTFHSFGTRAFVSLSNLCE